VTIENMRPEDWSACARIYEEGLDIGTFEEEVPSWEAWDAAHLPKPRLVAREDAVLGWAALAAYSARPCYSGVAEDSVYVGWAARGRGLGTALLEELVRRSEEVGVWTIQAGILAGNDASIALHERCGFRIVGARERIAKKRGAWRDVVVMERRSDLIA
jgi:phosphinothricin acetyltransferase